MNKRPKPVEEGGHICNIRIKEDNGRTMHLCIQACHMVFSISHACMDSANIFLTSGNTYMPPYRSRPFVYHYIHREDPCVKLVCMHEFYIIHNEKLSCTQRPLSSATISWTTLITITQDAAFRNAPLHGKLK